MSGKASLHAIPRSIWVLGFVSLLMDTSSEMIHSLLPVFLTSVLGVTPLWVGIIEGIAEAAAGQRPNSGLSFVIHIASSLFVKAGGPP